MRAENQRQRDVKKQREQEKCFKSILCTYEIQFAYVCGSKNVFFSVLFGLTKQKSFYSSVFIPLHPPKVCEIKHTTQRFVYVWHSNISS